MADNSGGSGGKEFDKNSIKHILLFALGVSLVCSVLVSASAVLLAERQDANVLLDQRRNILVTVGALKEGENENAAGQGINKIFESEFKQRIIDLSTGRFSSGIVDPASYDQIKAARDPEQSIQLSSDQDIALLRRRENFAIVYIRQGPDGKVSQIVLPVRGYGLWGTLYGYLALQNDYRTISGLGFYAHKETPGLGGEVDNPNWKAQWSGKRIYNNAGDPGIKLLKTGGHDRYSVDALAGATMTSRGVENLIKFWTGDMGFGPFLKESSQQ